MKPNDKKEQRYFKLYHALKKAAGPLCHLIFRMKKEDEIPLPKEPCLVVVNHTCYFDPLIVAMSVDQPLCFVTGENLLRHRFPAFLAVDVFRSIPCSKGKMNIGTILEISRSLKTGHYVCMFAEGNITYDGATAPLAPVNGKLFGALRCTVVTVAVTGAYQVIPRWSSRLSRGNVSAELKGVYTKEMLHNMTPEEIVARFNQDLYVEQPAAEDSPLAKRICMGKRPSGDGVPIARKTCHRSAKGIHYVLYACPECGSLGKIRGKGSKICCSGCGRVWEYNGLGKIEDGRFRTIWQWNRWQMGFVRELVESDVNIRLSDLNARLFRIADDHKRHLCESGILLLNQAKLSVGKHVFPLEKISRMDTRNKGVLLFSVNNEDYYEVSARKGFSGLMYKTFFEALKNTEK
ncbi:MAG: 1-acyl-sn-glycerol-3-phosphate acyltransferase [Lachnospiraceae bacterium]|nr:1-acyl-sn-glycerol-3-phosphate acyltransferase [Lachnospiraceae bacterium]